MLLSASLQHTCHPPLQPPYHSYPVHQWRRGEVRKTGGAGALANARLPTSWSAGVRTRLRAGDVFGTTTALAALTPGLPNAGSCGKGAVCGPADMRRDWRSETTDCWGNSATRECRANTSVWLPRAELSEPSGAASERAADVQGCRGSTATAAMHAAMTESGPAGRERVSAPDGCGSGTLGACSRATLPLPPPPHAACGAARLRLDDGLSGCPRMLTNVAAVLLARLANPSAAAPRRLPPTGGWAPAGRLPAVSPLAPSGRLSERPMRGASASCGSAPCQNPALSDVRRMHAAGRLRASPASAVDGSNCS
mmetsp:Transcript_16183/g.48136  ORF Transcript_16183/g.48136 Transcript_16183/m.48136 type:complete len:310 (+) Transcript_16183:672-1601(+)